jgi:hypothetical protein
MGRWSVSSYGSRSDATLAELDPIVERATKMRAPILQHTWLKVGGNGPGESTPFDFVELAKRHPNSS